MRRISGVASMAVLALVAVGLPAGAGHAVAPQQDHPSTPSAVEALRNHPAVALASDGTTFRVTDRITDASGATHVRMERSYQGLPVLGGDLVVHQGALGSFKGASQTLDRAVRVSTTPAVSRTAASRRVVRDAKSTRLVIDATDGTGRLAWEIVTGGTQADGTPSRLATYVDAATGEVLRREQQIQTVDGSGQSLYSGTVPLQLTLSGSTYQLKDPTRGNTYTTDMGNATDSGACQYFGVNCKTGTLFTSSDNLFGNGSTSSRESAAVDAQYGTNMTWDYFKTTHGRNGIFGNGTGSFNRVHYGKNYSNAFWDGTKMTYGDGDGVNYGPLVSLDVAGHEMSHGVTERSANLIYSGESGGLNEATSDIFGTLVEFYAANANDPADYLIGEEFDLKKHLGFRRMDNPSADGSSANCWYSGVGNLDVHYSSGVGNHLFYLLAEGSGAKTIGGVAHNSTTCNGSTITGIGRAAAGAIWYRALTVYMTSSTNYAGARTATLNAARDLYGATSTQYATTAAAWSAVSVN